MLFFSQRQGNVRVVGFNNAVSTLGSRSLFLNKVFLEGNLSRRGASVTFDGAKVGRSDVAAKPFLIVFQPFNFSKTAVFVISTLLFHPKTILV